jgi:hypothetical protein
MLLLRAGAALRGELFFAGLRAADFLLLPRLDEARFADLFFDDAFDLERPELRDFFERFLEEDFFLAAIRFLLF